MRPIIFIIILFASLGSLAQHPFVAVQETNSRLGKAVPFLSDSAISAAPEGYQLIWSDEFEKGGRPNERYWSYEHGFVRNKELQWYRPKNASVENGLLIIEGKRERVNNNRFSEGSKSWRQNRKYAEYTSACVITKDKFSFQYGILKVRARIDTARGMWPAIWTLGINKPWPSNGEVDVMEYYLIDGEPTILANAAWAENNWRAKWDSEKVPFSKIVANDAEWTQKFHTWKMEWTEEYIRLYLDEELLNEIDLTKTINPDDFNPFHQPHYILLNLAIGANGGDPSKTDFPRKYEIDYVRVFQKAKN